MNAPQNPYSPTRVDLEASPPGVLQLATRGTRLGAAIIDGLISLAFVFPYMWFSGTFEAAMRGQQMSFTSVLAMGGAGFAFFLLVHGYLLYRSGQTIGKKLLNIAIVTLEGNKPDFLPLVAKRYLPIQLASMIPFVGSFPPMIDVLFIFREDRRCVHDLIAGTRVINAS
ncbi:hypothetical protein IGB42_02189 [Andreprevotia sp. IGB-42]|nr:hypothetical protein IGB42_02189 [Andreprevotia sp. IGB-42]